MPKRRVLPGLLACARRGKDHSSFAGHTREILFRRTRASSAHLGHEDLGAHASREAAIKDAEQVASRDGGEALGQFLKRDACSLDVPGRRVVSHEVWLGAPCPEKK